VIHVETESAIQSERSQTAEALTAVSVADHLHGFPRAVTRSSIHMDVWSAFRRTDLITFSAGALGLRPSHSKVIHLE
jgi:hypothetical protein